METKTKVKTKKSFNRSLLNFLNLRAMFYSKDFSKQIITTSKRTLKKKKEEKKSLVSSVDLSNH